MILKAIKERLRQEKTVLLQIKVIPKSSRSGFVGQMLDGSLKIRVTAAPDKGKANQELVEWLASYFEVPRSHVEIISGETSARKLVRITGP